MTKLNIWLNFPGNCEEAFYFYKSVFGGDLIMLQRYKEIIKEGDGFPQKDENKLTFVGLPVGKEDLLMGDDYLESHGYQYVQGNNIGIEVHTESKEKADRIYNALSVGGTIKMPIADQFWGTYYGYFTDKFGIKWAVSYHNPKTK